MMVGNGELARKSKRCKEIWTPVKDIASETSLEIISQEMMHFDGTFFIPMAVSTREIKIDINCVALPLPTRCCKTVLLRLHTIYCIYPMHFPLNWAEDVEL